MKSILMQNEQDTHQGNGKLKALGGNIFSTMKLHYSEILVFQESQDFFILIKGPVAFGQIWKEIVKGILGCCNSWCLIER